ncbi:glycosyltransferase family 61 protein [Flavivirga jejuensis]|uniref:Glycosyltransferase family 61 protein n=1 Tax=Flavivirga jejuensis TaxID=870487 RepID=A0ABT8WLC2_9FLAO|nr:glycosyltransferase family 61 protein [Flavivirga jejuensis]MDO5973956.1 glycosyltransferase family 61 protein [Flavivirga jejuensis]
MAFKNIKLRNLFVKELKDVEVIDHGVIVNSEGYIELESTIFQKEYLNKLNCNHWVYLRKLFYFNHIEKAIVLSNYLEQNYYHWILECVSRLVIIKTEELNKYKIVIDSKSPKFVIDSLINLLDINQENIFLKKNKRLKVSNVLIPSFPHTRDESTSWTNVYNPSVIRKINSLSKRKTIIAPRKRNFIISRKKATQRRILNSDIILKKYTELCFEIVFLEDLLFTEQMQLFRNAGIIISTHGAGLTNLIFSEQPVIVEFFPSNRYNRDAFYFYQISSELDFSHYIIEFEAKNAKQDLFLDENTLSELDKVITEYKNV